MRLRHSLLAATALLAFGASAQEVSYDFVACTHGKRTVLEQNADIVSFATEGWGTVASSTTREFENASTHCMGYMRLLGGKPYGKGNCKWVFASGDTAVGEYEFGQGPEPKFTWLAGTGKLKGIQGGGTFKTVFDAKPAQEGTGQGCRRDWGKFKVAGG